MRQLFTTLCLLTFFFLTTNSFAAKNANIVTSACQDFSGKSHEEKEALFTEKRKQFIESLQLEKSSGKLLELLNTPSVLDESGSLPLHRIPAEVARHYPDIPAAKIFTFVEVVKKLDDAADCYNLDELTPEQVMKFRLYPAKGDDQPDDSYDEPYVGFQVPDAEEGKRFAKATTPSECSAGHCEFSKIKLDKNLGRNLILLTYSPTQVSRKLPEAETIETPAPVSELPARVILTRLDLEKTGEMFTAPEISVQVTYYNGNTKIREDMVPIPWAKERGVNKGRTELIVWQKGTSVRLTLIENDWDIPYLSLASILAKVVSFALDQGSSDYPVLEDLKKGLDDMKDKIGNHSEEINAVVKRVNQDDLIDTLKITREELRKGDSQPTYVPMQTGNAKMAFEYLYTPKEGLRDEL